MNQATEALKLANVEREAKKIVKQRIKAGADPIKEILTTERSFTVAELLTAIPRIGKVKASKIAKAAGVRPADRVRDLHDIQRQKLAVVTGRKLEEMPDRALYQRRRYHGEIAA